MNKNLRIAYEDNNIIICNKPVGVLSQADKSFSPDLVSMLRTYLVSKGKPDSVHIINRLDRPVGGLVLFALNPRTAAALSAMSGEHSIEKNYYAIVEGEITTSGEFSDYLWKDAKNNSSKVVPEGTKDARKAVLFYEPVEMMDIEGIKHTLVRITLKTGRHHQIRVQFSSHGHPLMGDIKYNPRFQNERGVSPQLFAYKLSFKNPAGVDRITVEVIPDGIFRDFKCFS